jgi:hypothetical protein
MNDTIHITVPLFLRVLELARESIKHDRDLHTIAELAVELSQDRALTMADYDALLAVTSVRDQLEDIRRLGGLV